MNNGKAKLHWDDKHYKLWFDRHIEKAEQAKKDFRKKDRLACQECSYCFYLSSKIGGSAMTSWECALCPKSAVNGSTNTPVLCSECAKREDRCTSCGGKMF